MRIKATIDSIVQMKPAPFKYYRAKSARDALEELHRHGNAGRASILAGGQSLVPSLALREVRPDLVVDIMGCAELRELSVSDSLISIGAGCTQSEIEYSQAAQKACPILVEALRWVAVPQVRTRGTVVGSLVQANAGGELPVVAVTLNAQVLVMDVTGTISRIAAGSFYDGAVGSNLPPNTLAIGVEFPVLAGRDGWSFQEIQLRPGHFSLACTAAIIRVRDGAIDSARIGIGGLTPNPYRARSAEASLMGTSRDDFEEAFLAAAATAVSERPWPSRDDIHATGIYRETITRKTVRDALAVAAARADCHLKEK